ncbi:hypothetical protein B0H16DRAFT_417591 [Mycena metata]|uniref:Uncharacterized protein n=1 Tax=Mycena metata TaxID=1033252 RepID=A0AAD7JI63_9AGAR|nr:hypothetical protein B0H16DRAFT_417591 [Mycena metata]
MAIELGEGQRSWTARFLATICDVFGALTYLFYTLWTRTIRAHTPDVAERYCKTPLLLDCEKGYRDVYQSRAQLLAALKRRDAADAAFEAEVLALLTPVKQRLAELACNGSGGPQGTDRTPIPLCHAGTRTQAPASLRPTHDRETTPDLPPAPQIFYDREQELTVLVDAFAPPHWHRDARPARIALVGAAPGAGTSTLALAFLHRAETARAFGRRRFLVRCTDSAAGDIAALASVLGLPHTPANSDPVRVLATLAACPLQTLLVLDGVRDPTAVLPTALARMPRVALLLTMHTPVELVPVPSGSPAGHDHYTAVHLGPLPLPAARALFRAIADLPACAGVPLDAPTPPSQPLDASSNAPIHLAAQPDSDTDAALIDALLLRAACLPRAVVELAQRAQYEPLPFLLARCLEEEGGDPDLEPGNS